MEKVNAINTRGMYDLVEYSGHLVLKKMTTKLHFIHILIEVVDRHNMCKKIVNIL